MSKKKPLKPKALAEQIESKELQRRHIRYKLYMIKNGQYKENDGLKEFIEAQFKPGHSWEVFTFVWDVAANDPFKVIVIEEWVKFGGRFDELGRRSPPAFTCQK